MPIKINKKKVSVIDLKNLNNNVFAHIFFCTLLLELFTMGSGQLLSVDHVSARMFLFVMALTLSLLVLFYLKKIDKTIFLLLLCFFLVTLLSVTLGFLNGASAIRVLQDIKPLSYFLMIVYFSIFIKSDKDVNTIVKLIKYSACILAIIYLLYLYLMYFRILNFNNVYRYVSLHSTDIFFRGDNNSNPGLFYKGFLYLNIGFIFWVNSKKWCLF